MPAHRGGAGRHVAAVRHDCGEVRCGPGRDELEARDRQVAEHRQQDEPGRGDVEGRPQLPDASGDRVGEERDLGHHPDGNEAAPLEADRP